MKADKPFILKSCTEGLESSSFLPFVVVGSIASAEDHLSSSPILTLPKSLDDGEIS